LLVHFKGTNSCLPLPIVLFVGDPCHCQNNIGWMKKSLFLLEFILIKYIMVGQNGSGNGIDEMLAYTHVF